MEQKVYELDKKIEALADFLDVEILQDEYGKVKAIKKRYIYGPEAKAE